MVSENVSSCAQLCSDCVDTKSLVVRFNVSLRQVALPVLLDLLLSSVLEVELDTLHSAFVDFKHKTDV